MDSDSVHKAFRDLAAQLERDGADPEDIVDALLVLGINGGVRIGGDDMVAHFLEETAVKIKAGIKVGSTRH